MVPNGRLRVRLFRINCRYTIVLLMKSKRMRIVLYSRYIHTHTLADTGYIVYEIMCGCSGHPYASNKKKGNAQSNFDSSMCDPFPVYSDTHGINVDRGQFHELVNRGAARPLSSPRRSTGIYTSRKRSSSLIPHERMQQTTVHGHCAIAVDVLFWGLAFLQ